MGIIDMGNEIFLIFDSPVLAEINKIHKISNIK